jgi:putative nucleotidyltransferase with HDIG domain
MFVFTLPILWRHSVLANRVSTLRTTAELVRSIANVVDLKDGCAGSHTNAVATTAIAIAREMGKNESFVEEVESAAVLHDIGKASWPNKVLTQRASWDTRAERYRYVHPDMSAEIATWAGYQASVADAIRTHHEHFDGSGYMQGLKGRQIPLGGRILRAADAFGSMIHARDPRFGRTLPEAVRELRFGAGKQFDPEVVAALLKVLEQAVFGDPDDLQQPEPGRVTEGVGVGA